VHDRARSLFNIQQAKYISPFRSSGGTPIKYAIDSHFCVSMQAQTAVPLAVVTCTGVIIKGGNT
jgi:hypothetical protein